MGSNTAIWMSNDGHLMLFGVFNDTNVMEQKFPWYGSNSDTGSLDLYPEIKSIRYKIFLIIRKRKLGVKIKFSNLLVRFKLAGGIIDFSRVYKKFFLSFQLFNSKFKANWLVIFLYYIIRYPRPSAEKLFH